MNTLARFSRSDFVSRPGVVACAALVLAALPAAAQGHKLSSPLPRAPLGFVQEVQVSPDGVWAVYLDEGLLSVPVKGDRAATRLDALGAPGAFWDFALTSDGARVVFIQGTALQLVPIEGGATPITLAEGVGEELVLTPDGDRAVFTMRGTAGTPELFSVLLEERAEPVQLDPAFDGEIEDDLQISPDSARAVYRMIDGAGHARLYAAPVDGSAPPRELGPISSLGGAQPGFRISADGERVVFLHGTAIVELFSTPLEGEAGAVKLNGSLAPNSDVATGFELSPDGQHAFYRARLAGRTRVELYRVSAAGSASTRLTPEFAQGGFVRDFALTPDGGRVVYRADQDTPGVVELYALPAAGGAATRLNGPLVGGGDVLSVHPAPDGEHVVYRADQEIDGEPVLYSVVLSHPAAPVRLADSPHVETIPPGPVVRFSRAGDHLVFTTRLPSERSALNAVRVDGSSPARVLAPSVEEFGAPDKSFQFVPGSLDVVCRGAILLEEQFELFRVALEGDEPALRLSLPLLPGRVLTQVEDFRVTPDGAWSVYRTGVTHGWLGGDEVVLSGEVEAVSLEGERRSVSLYPAGASGAEDFSVIGGIETSPDGEWVVIRGARDEYDGTGRLFAAPLDGHLPTQPLTPQADEILVLGFGADDRVVYGAVDWTSTEPVGLFSVALDGGAAPLELSNGLPAGGSVQEGFGRVDPTGQRVVFFFEIDGGGSSLDLYAAATDGSTPPVRLNTALGHGALFDALISPDGWLVVFAQDSAGNGVYEIYSVPIDASAPPLRLNPALPVFGDAYPVAISPDGTRVLFGADLVTNDVFDLFAVPVTGGPAVALTPPLPAGRAFRLPRFTPDGAHVLYVADQEQDDVFELYSVPSAGGASPVKLSQPLVAGGDVDISHLTQLHVTADARVLYRADATLDERYELWSVPLAGGTPLLLSQTLPVDADVLPAFTLSPDGKSVLYQADAAQPDVFELFIAPTDREKSARRVNGPLPPGGTLGPDYPGARFEFAGRSDRVVYLASEDTPGTMELFGRFLGRARVAGGGPSAPFER